MSRSKHIYNVKNRRGQRSSVQSKEKQRTQHRNSSEMCCYRNYQEQNAHKSKNTWDDTSVEAEFLRHHYSCQLYFY